MGDSQSLVMLSDSCSGVHGVSLQCFKPCSIDQESQQRHVLVWLYCRWLMMTKTGRAPALGGGGLPAYAAAVAAVVARHQGAAAGPI